MNPLCIYHGNCADGFTAAWAVRQALGDIECHAAGYGQTPPDVAGRDVIIVDFSYPRDVLQAMNEQANSVLVLDHHKSAAEDLAGLPEPPECWEDWIEHHLALAPDMTSTMAALFDLERSGAGIAWDFFHDAPRPALVDHVEDRDIFRFALEDTEEIMMAVFSREYTWENWDSLAAESPYELYREGRAILRKHRKDVRELIRSCEQRMRIGGHLVPVLNAPYFYSTEAGHIMSEGEPFAACYWDSADARTFSLRSREDGVDVSAIAKQYGGGGHRGAAGFRMPVGWEGDVA
ncbi:phosphohydrolase [Ectothiorhodospiraceae bacterium WFHF3C12]|nr:phosphohydrolase [Ectothiorhodospiraceae bacterium WFHF3C12]